MAAKVTFSVPRGTLFVGSYHRIALRFEGVAFNDLVFVIPDGPPAGLISPSRDTTFNAKRPHVMLCVGFRPGKYLIEARHAATNALLGTAKFISDALWRDEDAGP